MAEAYNYMIAHMHDGCCSPWPYSFVGGYASVYIGYQRKATSTVVCELTNGPKPSLEHQAAHKCGKGSQGCFNASCMYWATPTQNAADRELHGNNPKGERNGGGGKLTEADVIEMRRLRSSHTLTQLANQFHVDTTMVSRICRREAWSHV